MEELIITRYSDKYKLIVDLIAGTATMSEMIEHRIQATQKGQLRPGVSTIAIVFGEQDALSHGEVEESSARLLKEIPFLETNKTAIVTNHPVSTAYVMLYSRKSPQQNLKAFSSVHSALDWLEIDSDAFFEEFSDLTDHFEAYGT